MVVFGGVVGDDCVVLAAFKFTPAPPAAVATDSNEVVVESKELADADPPAAAVCNAATVGEILVSLRVSGSALRGKIPDAKEAAAMSAALIC